MNNLKMIPGHTWDAIILMISSISYCTSRMSIADCKENVMQCLISYLHLFKQLCSRWFISIIWNSFSLKIHQQYNLMQCIGLLGVNTRPLISARLFNFIILSNSLWNQSECGKIIPTALLISDRDWFRNKAFEYAG